MEGHKRYKIQNIVLPETKLIQNTKQQHLDKAQNP